MGSHHPRFDRAPAPLIRCAALLILAASGMAALGASRGPAHRASAPWQAYRESIPHTLVTFEMIPVPGGSVTVDGRAVDVAAFHIGRTEVTWDLYDVFALRLDERQGPAGADAIARPSQPYGAPDYGWGHAGYPAISVTREAAEAFCAWLSTRTGKLYRLPTEAEWQHAASLAGGTGSLQAGELDAMAWHRGNAASTTHSVAARRADRLGLFDLFGNAAEWVTTGGETRVVRGGSFRDPLERLGPAARDEQTEEWNERDPQLPKSRWWLSDAPFVGFRIVRAGAVNPARGGPVRRAPREPWSEVDHD